MFQQASIVSGKNYSLRSVMFSRDAESLRRFYEKFGLKFTSIPVGRKIHYICSNATLAILEGGWGNQCLGGLGIYEVSDNDEGGELQEYNEGNTLFYGHFSIPRNDVNDTVFSSINPKPWISIIRSENIDETRDFYKDIGQWDLEKHADGPEHYAFVHRSDVFELYPVREGEWISIEYIFCSSIRSGIHYDPDGRRIFIINSAKL